MGGFHAHHRWIIAGKANNTSSEYKKLSATAKKQLKNITQKLEKLVEE
jgi:hypothetical protein